MVLFPSLVISCFPSTVIMFLFPMPSVRLIGFSFFPLAVPIRLQELNPLFLLLNSGMRAHNPVLVLPGKYFQGQKSLASEA